jgi:hypothetical protein
VKIKKIIIFVKENGRKFGFLVYSGGILKYLKFQIFKMWRSFSSKIIVKMFTGKNVLRRTLRKI